MVIAAYNNGKIEGYAEGYKNAIVEFAKYLKDNSKECDCNVIIFDAIDTDDLDNLAKDFLELHNLGD